MGLLQLCECSHRRDEPSQQGQGQGQGGQRGPHAAGRGAPGAQVEQAALEVELPGVLSEGLPDGARLLLTV